LTGLFEGQSLSIANLTIASSAQNSGLFSAIGSAGTVRNLNLSNVNVTGTGSLALIGTLAGQNDGTISNVHVLSGTVSAGTQTGVDVGGLVARNTGLIQNSSSAANVAVGDSTSPTAFNFAGGLVGRQFRDDYRLFGKRQRQRRRGRPGRRLCRSERRRHRAGFARPARLWAAATASSAVHRRVGPEQRRGFRLGVGRVGAGH
jgi:hypothetical protein